MTKTWVFTINMGDFKPHVSPSSKLENGQIQQIHGIQQTADPDREDPALLRTLYREAGPLPRSQTPDRHLTSSTPSLHTHDRYGGPARKSGGWMIWQFDGTWNLL